MLGDQCVEVANHVTSPVADCRRDVVVGTGAVSRIRYMTRMNLFSWEMRASFRLRSEKATTRGWSERVSRISSKALSRRSSEGA